MAKAKKSTPPAPKTTMAKRRKKRRQRVVTTTSSRTVRTVRQNPRANPPITDDLTGVLLPGFLAYAGTRVLQRVVYSLVQRRWPQLGKHAHALAGAAAFGGVWFFAHKINAISKYHDGIVMGSGVAAAHGLAQCYMPQKYSWLLADCKPSDVRTALPATDENATNADPAEEADEYSYLEEQLDQLGRAGRPARTVRAPRRQQRPVASAMAMANQGQSTAGVAMDPDLTEELGNEDVDDLYSGAFAQN